MARVVAMSLGGEDVAYAFTVLRERPAIDDEVGDVPIAVFWNPGTASALDRRQISEGRDVGATGVFDQRLDGHLLSFDPLGDGRFRDRVTRSEFDVLGRAIAGPLRGTRLQPVPHGNHFWFAWVVFKPSTRV
ncbi:MAG: DUF3179 domain-containing (seleno)protein, partial [Gemmatimonadales bacterium]